MSELIHCQALSLVVVVVVVVMVVYKCKKSRVTMSGYLASGLVQVEGFVPEGLALAF